MRNRYDHFGFQNRRAVVYNANVYMAALVAAEQLAGIVGDNATAASASKALSTAQSRTVDVFWNETSKFFRTADTGNQCFTDSLYGQMLMHHMFGNFTLDETYLKQHLAYEWQQNQDIYGMRVLSNPIQEDR